MFFFFFRRACRLAKEAATAVRSAIAALENAETSQLNLADPLSPSQYQEQAAAPLPPALSSRDADEDDDIITRASVLGNPLVTLASCAEDTPQDSTLWTQDAVKNLMQTENAASPRDSWRTIRYDQNALRTSPSRRTSPPGSPLRSSLLPKDSGLQTWHQKIVMRLYQERSDASTRHDPIALNLVTGTQAELLVAFYFDNLRQWIHLLDPRIHSLSYIRARSPFLLTAICLVSAYFNDKCSHLSHHLSMHIDTLLARMLTEGHRSIELVQGLCLLAAWAPARDDADTERAWSLIGLAM